MVLYTVPVFLRSVSLKCLLRRFWLSLFILYGMVVVKFKHVVSSDYHCNLIGPLGISLVNFIDSLGYMRSASVGDWNTVSLSYTQIAKFMGPRLGSPGSCRPQMGPMLAPWNLLWGICYIVSHCLGQLFTFRLPVIKCTKWEKPSEAKKRCSKCLVLYYSPICWI